MLAVALVLIGGLARLPADERARTATEPVGPVIDVPAGVRTQPAVLMYAGTEGSLAYAKQGSLVVAGRTNYHDPAFTEVARRGGRVLLYLDPVVINPYGRYHELLFDSSACGPAVPAWPGTDRASEWGYLSDFRPGSVLQAKLRCVLETMVAENPQSDGWFADDVGSRSWFPGIPWDSWSPREQEAYRAGAIEITRTMRQVADEHGLVFMVNGTWSAGSVSRDGGGYPDLSQDGNALADGGVVEHHDTDVAFFQHYACSTQWADQSALSRGKPLQFAITSTVRGLAEYAASGCFAYANVQNVYDFAPPWVARPVAKR